MDAEQLGLGALGEPQRQGDARRIVVLTLLDGCHRHVDEQRDGDDQDDRRDELDDAQPRPPTPASLTRQQARTATSDQRKGLSGPTTARRRRRRRGERARRGRCRSARRGRAPRRGPVAPGDHVLRRTPAEQPARRRERAAHVEQGEQEGGEREGGPRDRQLHRQRASDDRESRVECVRERPGGPDAERLELGLAPHCAQPAGEMVAARRSGSEPGARAPKPSTSASASANVSIIIVRGEDNRPRGARAQERHDGRGRGRALPQPLQRADGGAARRARANARRAAHLSRRRARASWPQRRIASVLGGVFHLRQTEFAGRRPYRFLGARESCSGRWEIWVDAAQAKALRRASG